jgi:hypothetical protein
VTDHHGKSVFSLPNAGPMTNLKLPKGDYDHCRLQRRQEDQQGQWVRSPSR